MICLARQRADFPVVNPRAEMPVEQSNGFGKPVENIRFFFWGVGVPHHRLFTRAIEVAAQAGDVAGVHGDADAVDESERLVGGYLLQVYDIYILNTFNPPNFIVFVI